MLFMVEMDLSVPLDFDKDEFERLKAVEKTRAQELQDSGTWRHLWRVAGRYSNVSIFDVPSTDVLHEIMMGLPLYPFMEVKVTALCRHPSSVRDDDT
jgi:muconolactone D-isomerase